METTLGGETYIIEYQNTREKSLDMLDKLIRFNRPVFAVDLETMPCTGYEDYEKAALYPTTGRPRLIQVFAGTKVQVLDLYDFSHSDYVRLNTFIEKKFTVGHNYIFDLQFFLRTELMKSDNACTMIMFKLIMNAIEPESAVFHGGSALNAVYQRLFKEQISKENQNSRWWLKDLSKGQIEYAALDVIATYKIYMKLLPLIKKLNMEKIFRLLCDVQLPAAKIKADGFYVDKTNYKSMVNKWKSEMNTQFDTITASLGLDNLKPSSIARYLTENLEERELAAWPRTATGKLSTAISTFEDNEDVQGIEPLIEYSRIKKLVSSFGDKFLSHLCPDDRLRSSLVILGAKTGRYSCYEPNIQQIAKDSSIRNMFKAEEGKVLVVCDFSQIEVRVAAEMSREPLWLQAYANGDDIYVNTASVIFKCAKSQVTKEQRMIAKITVLGTMYGIGKKKLHGVLRRAGASISLDEVAELLRTYYAVHSTYKRFMDENVAYGERHGVIKTVTGLTRKLCEEKLYGASLNTPIQGTAAEIMHWSLLVLWEKLSRVNILHSVRFCATVHDEIVLETPRKYSFPVSLNLEESMTDGFLKVFPTGIARDIAKASIGETWAEAK